jgi:hypothetical protein
LELSERLGVAGGLTVSDRSRTMNIEINHTKHNQMVMHKHFALTLAAVVN